MTSFCHMTFCHMPIRCSQFAIRADSPYDVRARSRQNDSDGDDDDDNFIAYPTKPNQHPNLTLRGYLILRGYLTRRRRLLYELSLGNYACAIVVVIVLPTSHTCARCMANRLWRIGIWRKGKWQNVVFPNEIINLSVKARMYLSQKKLFMQ